MIRRFVVAATLLGLVGCATSAPEPAAPVAPEVPKAANLVAGNERVCRYERETGSHMRIRVCRTREEIEGTRNAAERVLRELNSRSSIQDLEGN